MLFMKKLTMFMAITGLIISTDILAENSDFPNRQIDVIVTFPPGGGTDLLARLIGAPLGGALGQPVVVENKPGASGNIAGRYVARAKPDGHTLLMVNSSYAVNPAVFSTMPFDPITDLSAVVNFAYVPLALIVPSDSPYQTIQNYLEAAKRGEDVFYGSCGNGTPPHMAGELLNQVADIKLTHVPYAGCGPAVNDVMANQVGSAIVAASSAMPHIQAGKIRALAVTSKNRSEFLPDIPSISEIGYSDYEVNQWHGFLVPKLTPIEVKEKIAKAVSFIIQDESIANRMKTLGYVIGGENPSEFDEIVKGDIYKFKKLSQDIDLKLN